MYSSDNKKKGNYFRKYIRLENNHLTLVRVHYTRLAVHVITDNDVVDSVYNWNTY